MAEKSESKKTEVKADKKVSLPTLEIPSIYDAENDELNIPKVIPDIIKFVGKLPSLPADILKVIPGEIPLEKWIKKFNELSSDAQKMISACAEKVNDLTQKTTSLGKQLAETTISSTRKVIENELAETKKGISSLKDLQNVFTKLITLVVKLIQKLTKLFLKIIEWATTKITELLQLPPILQKWVKKLNDSPLVKILTGGFEFPSANPVEIVKWLINLVKDVISEIILFLFRPYIEEIQKIIDTINSYTKHPRTCTISFAFWSDIPSDILESDTMKDMVPDKLKDVVEGVIDVINEIEDGIEQAGEELEQMVEETMSDIDSLSDSGSDGAASSAESQTEESSNGIEINVDSPLSKIEKVLEKIFNMFKLDKNNDGSKKTKKE